ncbi:hypothetical protein B0H12DRAFT_511736 [Mycena haematopus]|nr:hypothetical protein B0H12DRAFT_511736 [Mycena haematopus]
MLRSFNVGADQLVSIIEEERASASEVSRQQLAQTQNQFNAFRNAAYTSFAQNEAIIIQHSQEIETLMKKVQEYQELQHTLGKVGIYYHHGRLAFGDLWGEVACGLRPGSPNLPRGPPFLLPTHVVNALAEQCRAENSRRGRNLAKIARLENLVRWYQDIHETKFPPALNINLAPPVVGTKALKREMEAPVLEPAAKRSRLNAPVQPDRAVAGTPMLSAAAAFSPVSVPTPTFSHQIHTVGDTSNSSPQIMTNATPTLVSPVIDRWNYALTEPVVSGPSREFVLPPLAAFVDAHSCTYYLWFSIRMSLYRRLGDPQSTCARTTSTAEQWELKLHNDRKGTRKFCFNQKVFDTSGVRCTSCGMPPILPSISHNIPRRADGTPIQSTDLDSPVLQAFILADLELAHAKLQFEQTDDILLDVQSRSAYQWAQRLEARGVIFRNSWDPSFTTVPLETPDLTARRPWIVDFHDLLRSWPKSESIGPLPVLETGEGVNPGYLDALTSFEQRMIAFYLETVSRTLGTSPARPRNRLEIEALPEPYRNMLL